MLFNIESSPTQSLPGLAQSLLNEKQAAKRLNCSVAVLRKWRTLGQGPAYCKIRRMVRYPVPDIEAFIALMRVEPHNERVQ